MQNPKIVWFNFDIGLSVVFQTGADIWSKGVGNTGVKAPHFHKIIELVIHKSNFDSLVLMDLATKTF